MSKRTKNGRLKSLKNKHDKKVSEIEKIEKDIINQVFDNYINKEAQEQLIKDAKTFHYSETKISNVQKVFDNFNTDTIEYNFNCRHNLRKFFLVLYKRIYKIKFLI